MKTFHREKQTGHTCYHLRWSAILLEAKNRRKMVHFTAPFGLAYRCVQTAGAIKIIDSGLKDRVGRSGRNSL